MSMVLLLNRTAEYKIFGKESIFVGICIDFSGQAVYNGDMCHVGRL